MKEKNRDRFIRAVCIFVVVVFALICILPFLYVLTVSIEPYEEYMKNPIALFPKSISFSAYKQLLNYHLMYTGFGVTVFITVVGTLIGVFLLLISAYPLSKPDLKGRNVILALVTFTMFFNGGLIPNYYLIRNLGMINTVWALIFPSLMSAYNLIVMKSFMAGIPRSLEEAAAIDGANEFTILFRIIMPLSLPAIVTFAVFLAVGYWNSFFNAVIYTTKRDLWPLMLILRELVVEDGTDVTDPTLNQNPYTLKMASIILTTLPILCVYPFAQKYFTKGVMLGSVKE
jgi:putative aldouronate transport system permease protein